MEDFPLFSLKNRKPDNHEKIMQPGWVKIQFNVNTCSGGENEKKGRPLYRVLVYFSNSDRSMKLASKWISDYVWREKSQENGTRATESANSTSAHLPTPAQPPATLLGCHKTQCNRIPKLFQWLLPLSHGHLSALIHDKLSHLIHDKSSEGPIETRRWKGGGLEGKGRPRTRGWSAGGRKKRDPVRGEGCSAPEWSASYCQGFFFLFPPFITSKGTPRDKKWDRIAPYLSPLLSKQL